MKPERLRNFLAEKLADEGFEVDSDPKVEIQNLVVRADFGATIDLSKLHNSSYETSYNPGSFPGLLLELDEPDATILLFTGGQAILHAERGKSWNPHSRGRARSSRVHDRNFPHRRGEEGNRVARKESPGSPRCWSLSRRELRPALR